LNKLRNTKDNSLKIAIIAVLSYKRPKRPNYLKIVLENKDLIDNNNNLSLPGSFCNYKGWFYNNLI